MIALSPVYYRESDGALKYYLILLFDRICEYFECLTWLKRQLNGRFKTGVIPNIKIKALTIRLISDTVPDIFFWHNILRLSLSIVR